jgi:two-component system chemotaxis response regulator CheB
MNVALDENLRRALGSALRALEERRALASKLEAQANDNNQLQIAASWGRRAREFEQELKIIRSSIERIDRLAARQEIKDAAE